MAVLVGVLAPQYLSYIHKAKSGCRPGESEELFYGISWIILLQEVKSMPLWKIAGRGYAEDSLSNAE